MTHSPHTRFENHIAKAAEGALSADERAHMRFVVKEYAAMKPVRVPIERETHALWTGFARYARYAFAFLLVLALGSGSAAYAAEGALPGDTLYPVKVGVTEPIRTALQATPAEKASWEMTLATRRIDEATALAAKGSLSTSTEAVLAARFEASATAADEAVAEVGTSSPDEASVARATFTVRLAAYRAVLARLDAEHRASSTDAFQAALGARIALDTSAPSRPAVFSTKMAPALAAPSSSASSSSSKADLSKISVAVNASLDRSAALLDSLTRKLTASTSAAAKDEFARVTALASRGKDLEDQGDDSGALLAYQDSLSGAARLEVFAHAAMTYNVDAFPSNESSSSQMQDPGGDVHATAAPVRALVPVHQAMPSTTPVSATSTASSSTSGASSVRSPPVIPVPLPSSSQTQGGGSSSVFGVPTPPVPTPSVPGVVPNLF